MIGLAVAYAGLLVSVATLLWRVWRLEDAAKRALQNQRDGGDYLETLIKNVDRRTAEGLCRAESGTLSRLQSYQADVDRIGKNVSLLARALGYEWKRTDAKEGWERKSVFADVKVVNAPYNPFAPRSMYTGVENCGAPYAAAADRRKADRRKPTPQAAPKSPPKKRRATH